MRFLVVLVSIQLVFYSGRAKYWKLIIWFTQLIYFYWAALSDRIPCAKKFFPNSGGDSFVCVCNSTYCDTIESIDQDDKQTTYQEFITCKNGYRLDKFKNKFEKQRSNGKIRFKSC